MINTKGFTLAEVLLTFAIIGVVAALTIPAVVTKAINQQYVTGLKKAYNTLKSVEREAIREYGAMENWTWSNSDSEADFAKYFKEYFDILKDCGVGTNDTCFSDKVCYMDKAAGCITDFNATSNTYRMVTSDGMSFAYETVHSDWIGLFHVDVNGKKGPNRFGRDIFKFNVFNGIGIKPEGAFNANSYSAAMTHDMVDSNCVFWGERCAVKVLSEGAMNY